MQFLKLNTQHLPESESLEYRLEMLGAKGGVRLNWKVSGDQAELRCEAFASLSLPPKKLVDSHMVSTLGRTENGDWKLLRFTDTDFKSEARRHFELKDKLIETKHVKFEEERGFIDYPKDEAREAIYDPILALYLLRNPVFLQEQRAARVRVLSRQGILDVECNLRDQGSLQQLTFRALNETHVSSPLLSANSKVMIDPRTGIVEEIQYHLMGPLGKIGLYRVA